MDSMRAATHGSALISSRISCSIYILFSGLNADFSRALDAMLVCNLEHDRSSVTLVGELDHWQAVGRCPCLVFRIVVIISSDKFSNISGFVRFVEPSIIGRVCAEVHVL